jgi:2-aminoethylphosphonate-pyruvate transaminase
VQAFTLLNPGPINVSPRVRLALAECEDQCHREPEYLEMQGRVRDKLARAFDVAADYEVALLTGSGTAAMEAMVCSVVGTGVLVIENGVYGERLAAMARAHALAVKTLPCSWFERPDLDAVEAALEDGLDTIAVVHHETTTGLINDLDGLGELARRKGRALVVDSVSGLGGEPLDFRRVRPQAVCATANKCIQGLPGVSFVLVRRGTALARRSVYLDLETLLEKQRRGDTPFTPAIQVTAALEAALDELTEETVAGRVARYAKAAAAVRAAMAELRLRLLLPPPLRSNTITTASLPEGVGYEQVHARMRESGYVIYGGQGDLRKTAFRVANMGAIPPEALRAFPAALARAIA